MPLRSYPQRTHFTYDTGAAVPAGREMMSHMFGGDVDDTPGAPVPGTREDENAIFVPATPFHTTLRIAGLWGGKDKIGLFDDGEQMMYAMFPKDFVAMTQRADISDGLVTGTFGFVRKGPSYGIVLL